MMSAATLLVVLTFAQVPRDAQPKLAGTAAILGAVVSDDLDARPVRHARVTCTAPELAHGVTAVTDGNGRFTCDRLPPGRYSIAASRDGWMTGRPSHPIPVAPNQRVDVVIRMARGAVITGTVMDASGQPAVNVRVLALRQAVTNGERRLIAAGEGGTSDDRGVYRIFGLPAGDYLVGAAPPDAPPGLGPSDLRETSDLDLQHARAAAPGSPAPPQRTIAFAPTYFPGTPLPAQAVRVSINAGEEREGIDFAIELVATARISGALSLPDGAPLPSSAQIMIVAAEQTAFPGVPFDGLRSAHVPPDGTFSFSGVGPGVYSLLARAVLPADADDRGAPPRIVWAAGEIVVDGDPVTNLAFTLQPGLTISGQVRFASDGVRSPPDPASIRIAVESVQPAGGIALAPGAVSADRGGHFVLTGLTPGRYRVTASVPGRHDWTLRSAAVNGLDTLDTPLQLQPNQHVENALITFTDRPSSLRGRVEAADGVSGYTVVVFPTDRALWLPRARRIQAVPVDAEGAYAFAGLPPGEYVVAALHDVESGAWFDPAFLDRLLPAGMKIAVAEGEQKALDIRAAGGS
jgi:uncharacterized protein (DUF2141 family)